MNKKYLNSIKIGERAIGPTHPCFIVAELSANHGHSLARALETIRAIKRTGANAVKLQTYLPESLTLDSDLPWFKIGKGSPWEGRTLYSLYEEACTPLEWHEPLKREAEKLGLVFFSTPFDKSTLGFLEDLEVPLYKIASFELVDLPFIKAVAATGKPIILSTGMANLKEIEEAVSTIRTTSNSPLAILRCSSAYPAPVESVNLKTMQDLASTFGTPVGLSDHTLSSVVAIAAVGCGASIIEKHFILSRADTSPDAAFSAEPDEFAEMVKGIRIAERAMGTVQYELSDSEKSSQPLRRSLFAVQDINKGERLTDRNIRSIRPGLGLPPKEYPNLLGKIAIQDIRRGVPLSWEMIEKEVE